MDVQWVPRSSWKAARSSGSENRIPSHVYGLAVHYTGADVGPVRHGVCGLSVRQIQRYHQQTKGYADIAYNFLICRHGYVFVGRGTAAGSAAQGTNDGNAHYWAVCFLAGPHDVLTVEAMGAFTSLRLYLEQRNAGPKVRPHSYFTTTLCPGRIISSWLHLRFPEAD